MLERISQNVCGFTEITIHETPPEHYRGEWLGELYTQAVKKLDEARRPTENQFSEGS